MRAADRTLREFAGYSMKRAFTRIQRDIEERLSGFGLRMVTFSALTVIVDNPGLRQSQLADVLMIERPNLVLIIDELEQAELITRERALDDRRAYSLQATLAGRRLQERALRAVREHEQNMTAGLTEEERLALISALCRIEDIQGESHDRQPISRA